MPTPTTVQARFQVRADTAANWTTANPTLLLNEIGIETDTKKLKMGDGTTAWASLAYFPSIVSGGTVLGNLEIGTTGTLTFEGSTADGFETTLAVVDPTADRTITLPDATGTVILNSGGQTIQFGAGAEGTPSITTVGDLDTGIWFPAANTTAISTGGNERFRVTSTGSIGINDITPDALLTINGVASFGAGAAATPSIAARGDLDTGIYFPAANQVGLSAGGAVRLTTTTAQFTATLPWRGQDGTAASPAFSFSGDTDNGMYRVGTNSIGLSTGGTVRLTIASTGDTTFAGNVLLSGTGYLDLPAGTTAQRPGTPNSGMIRFNSDLTQFEGYNGTAWGQIGAGATGGGADTVFFENGQTVTTNYTLTTNKNAVSAGPITINAGITVTVPSGQSWVIV